MKKTWYQRIWEAHDAISENLEPPRELNPDNFPKYQANAASQLVRQVLPLTPLKELEAITPEKLGLVLGQKQALCYGLTSFLKEPEAVEGREAAKRQLEQQSHTPEAADDLAVIRKAELMGKEFFKVLPLIGKNIQDAFQAALDQSNYQEAVEFFQGFAQGLATQGFKDGTIVRRTEATELHLNMFMRANKFKKFENVKELRNFLWDHGFSLETLPDSRLHKYCQRIKYTPARRGRPAKSKK
jgi:hypothetical protein